MGWIWLFLAIALEVTGTIAMKLSAGFQHIVPSILMFVFYGASFTCLNFALQHMNVSTAYATWSGVGIVLITVIGYSAFKDQLNVASMLWIVVIIIGVIGLNMSSKAH